MKREMTEADLAKIQRHLHSAYCNPFWRKHVTDLMEEVTRLRELIGSIERFVDAAPVEVSSNYESDTAVV